LIISSIAGVVYVNGFIRAIKAGSSTVGLGLDRLVAGASCYIVEIIGAIILITGHIMGIYVAAIAMIIYIPFIISGAWLLMVGVHQDLNQRQKDRK